MLEERGGGGGGGGASQEKADTAQGSFARRMHNLRP